VREHGGDAGIEGLTRLQFAQLPAPLGPIGGGGSDMGGQDRVPVVAERPLPAGLVEALVGLGYRVAGRQELDNAEALVFEQLRRAGEEVWVVGDLADPVALPQLADELLDQLQAHFAAGDELVRLHPLVGRPGLGAQHDPAVCEPVRPDDRARVVVEGDVDAEVDVGAVRDRGLGAKRRPEPARQPGLARDSPLVQVQAAELELGERGVMQLAAEVAELDPGGRVDGPPDPLVLEVGLLRRPVPPEQLPLLLVSGDRQAAVLADGDLPVERRLVDPPEQALLVVAGGRDREQVGVVAFVQSGAERGIGLLLRAWERPGFCVCMIRKGGSCHRKRSRMS